MRRATEQRLTGPADQRVEILLWTAVLLPTLAALTNTIVGFTVAHWVSQVNSKSMSYVVSAVDFLLCLGAFLVAFGLHRQLSGTRQDEPLHGRRHFMCNLAMLISGLCLVVVLFQTIAVITLNPSD